MPNKSRPTANIFLAFIVSTSLVQTYLSVATAQEKSKTQAAPLAAIPKVVAVVDGQTISRDKLADDCLLRYGSTVLDNLLHKHLILQACQSKAINITQSDVNEEIARQASKFGLSTKLFLQALEEERDITPENYAADVTWPMLALRALAADQIAVQPEEIERILQSEYGAKVQVRMIAIANKARAEELHAEAVSDPTQFRRLAKEFSEDAPSASVEGLLPPIRRNGGDDQIERIAFQLSPDEISPIFPIGEMNIILQCVRHLPATPPSPQLLPSIKQRIEDKLRDQRLGEAANTIFAKLEETSEVITVIGNKELEQKYPGVAGYINRQPVGREELAAEVVKRHGREILRGEISRLLLKQSLQKNGKSVIQPDIDAEIAAVAELNGYINRDGSPDVDGWLKSIVEQEGVSLELYVQDVVWPSVALRKLVEDEVQTTEEDLQKGFEANFGPRAEVLAIILTNQRTAEEVFRQARENLTEANFGELAAKYSVEPMSRSNFGKVAPLRRHSGQPTLEKAAFELQTGEMSGVIALKDQYAILYKQGETKPVITEFAAVRAELEREIREKKIRVAMQLKLSSLRDKAHIENFLDGSVQNVASAIPALNQPSKTNVNR